MTTSDKAQTSSDAELLAKSLIDVSKMTDEEKSAIIKQLAAQQSVNGANNTHAPTSNTQAIPQPVTSQSFNTSTTTTTTTPTVRKCTNWIDSYVNDFTKDTRPPTKFNKWCAISAIAASVRRNVYIKSDVTIYPNLYIVLVGPPAVGKGVAMQFIRDFVLKRAGTANFITDRWTMEKIIEKLDKGFTKPQPTGKLTQDRSAIIVSKEFETFVTTSRGMVTFLTDIYDGGSYDYETKHQGGYNLEELCISLLAGTTPDYARNINTSYLNQLNIVTGGFASRCLHVFCDTPGKREPFPDPIDTKPIRQDLEDDLRLISNCHGEVTMSQEARDYYSDRYKKIYSTNNADSPDLIVGFKERSINSHVMKLAMILSIAESNNLIIEKHHFEEAFKLLDEVSNDMLKIFKMLGANKELELTENIMMYIKNKKQATLQEIYTANYRYLERFDISALERLLDGLIQIRFLRKSSRAGTDIYEVTRIP